MWELDETVVALAGDLSGAGSLTSLASRLRRITDRKMLTAQTPPEWTRQLLLTDTKNDFGVLIRSSALLAAFDTASRAPNSAERIEAVRGRYADSMRRLIKQLILIGAAPPTFRNFDALIMLGSLGPYAFTLVNDELEHALLQSPLGFRVWRAYTKLVRLAERDPSGAPVDSAGNRALLSTVRRLLTESAKTLRKVSLYPGRSLDLELAIAVPHEWSPAADDWVTHVLLGRARNQDATLRERCTAAHGVWQRAVQGPSHTTRAKRTPEAKRALNAKRALELEQARRTLEPLISDFRTSEARHRPDIAHGLEWGAATLEYVVETKVATCNAWPDVRHPWLAEIKAIAQSLDHTAIPSVLLPGTKTLFLHTLLQNAGVERRKAIDTLVAGGMTGPIVTAMGKVLEELGDEDAWLRIRAIFAVGFLQNTSQATIRILAGAFIRAHDRAMRDGPSHADLTELHASLFAIGDCLGAQSSRDGIDDLREMIDSRLQLLAASRQLQSPEFYPAARAMAYMLTVTAQPRTESARNDLSQDLLEKLEQHPDNVTSALSRKARANRFALDGSINSVLESPPW
ncbi:hypothetical protein ACQPYH_06225 [Kribbella sp. CA-245084]|uniref:hypothetical protein n=1 Tax=Kribbella sp. CA-245084 TaxID=3239940 RepID=UPI003D8DB746